MDEHGLSTGGESLVHRWRKPAKLRTSSAGKEPRFPPAFHMIPNHALDIGSHIPGDHNLLTDGGLGRMMLPVDDGGAGAVF